MNSNEDLKNVPVHVSIIMDGNGRWAKEKGQERVFGHKEGVESVRACIEAAVETGVKYLSVYAFSEENWNRPQEEVSALMSLMATCIEREIQTFMDNKVRFRVLGNRKRLNPALLAAIEGLEEMTAENDRTTFIVFLSYSGRWDILQAAQSLAIELAEHPERREAVENMSIADFDKYLVTAGIPDPDLIIRTSGETRISNYLLWQSAYTEFYFTDILWPDFRKPQFAEALAAFSKRDRRYGKVK